MNLEALRRHFDSRAPRYDGFLTRVIGERELRAIRPFVPPGSAVLDYGCGTGRTTIDLLRRGCRVTGYDLSAGMLAVATERAAAGGLFGEFTTDPGALSGRAWPIVTAIGVLDCYRDPADLLDTIAGYLAPGGRLVVTYPNALSPLSWLYALASRLTYPVFPRAPRAALAAARAAGLEVVGLRYAFPALPLVGHTLVLCLRRP